MKAKTKQPSNKKSRKVLSKASKRLAQCHAVVIGAGAIGRAVAILLASLGIRHMSLYDPALVTRKNLAQGFLDFDVGMAKVDAVANIAHQHNPHMELMTYRSRFRRSNLQKWKPKLHNAVFLCVNSMAARSIWNLIRFDYQFLGETRLGIKVIRVVTSHKPAMDTYYPSTLTESKRSPVRKHSYDIVMTTIAAGFVVAQFARWLRNDPVIRDQVFNLHTQELRMIDEHCF